MVTQNKKYESKKQTKIIISSGLLTIFITLIGDYTAGFYNIPSPTPALALLWIGALFFVITKYRMLEISPYTITLEILNSLEEIIVLFNPDTEINWFNKIDDSFFYKILSTDTNMISMFKHDAPTSSLIADLIAGNKMMVTFRYPFSINHEIHLYDVLLRTVKDSFAENIGYLMKVKKVKSITYLKNLFKITERETEVIKFLITGLSYSDISSKLDISENTLKTHVTNLYNKLGINNKVELINIIHNIEENS